MQDEGHTREPNLSVLSLWQTRPRFVRPAEMRERLHPGGHQCTPMCARGALELGDDGIIHWRPLTPCTPIYRAPRPQAGIP